MAQVQFTMITVDTPIWLLGLDKTEDRLMCLANILQSHITSLAGVAVV